MDKYLQRQIKAINMGIAALEDARRRYSDAHYAYKNGLRADEIPPNEDGITGTGFGWVESGEAKYQEYTNAITELNDLIEIISDPGATVEKQGILGFVE